jgi:calcineurin-like phosphoesterase family protein
MPLKTEDHTLKSDNIIWTIDAISSEMNVETAAAQLCTQIAARQKLIGANQHAATPGQTGQGFETIQLVGKTATAGDLGKVLSLVNQHCRRSAMAESLLQRLA